MLMFGFYQRREDLVELLTNLLLLINGSFDITTDDEIKYIEKVDNCIFGDKSLKD